MFRYLNDVDEDPFMMDPFAAHRQHMRSMFDPFGMDPFALAVPQMQIRPARRPVTAVRTCGVILKLIELSISFQLDRKIKLALYFLFFHLQERMTGSPNCQTFSSSTVISYSATDSGTPQVYQQTSETRTGPGGIRETRQSMRDSESGLERLAIGHHIGERAHIMERSRNRRTGDREERQDFINLDETEAAAFDEEFRREAGRYGPNPRSLDYRERRGGGQQLALTAPPSADSPSGHRQESPRHRQHQPRPRYDW
ncbi:myeloid leukemia factor 2 [Boleophthalmus pectinirostris]|uniref:myeloid leukemia factor 2 n=1 Tax=Boleophthalmus pectinirostris TaxID=150288 RepID=UPI00242A6299|nr:myeloid leukemia factor 2 [Boleophthalmus pectinirostris]